MSFPKPRVMKKVDMTSRCGMQYYESILLDLRNRLGKGHVLSYTTSLTAHVATILDEEINSARSTVDAPKGEKNTCGGSALWFSRVSKDASIFKFD